MARWFELIICIKTVAFTFEDDAPIWLLEPSSIYLGKSFYKMINLWGGVAHDLKDCIWKIKTPPNIHAFLWLIYNNKSLTRDNLAKRCHVADPTCVFCC